MNGGKGEHLLPLLIDNAGIGAWSIDGLLVSTNDLNGIPRRGKHFYKHRQCNVQDSLTKSVNSLGWWRCITDEKTFGKKTVKSGQITHCPEIKIQSSYFYYIEETLKFYFKCYIYFIIIAIYMYYR